jgi:hypothetical protein
MKLIVLSFSLLLFNSNSFGAKPHFLQVKRDLADHEVRFMELKAKKEINDKKSTNLRKYTIAILAARDFKFLDYPNKSIEFYKIAQDIKIDIDKSEIKDALIKKISIKPDPTFYFESNIKDLIKTKQFERAILSMNPDALEDTKNESLRIVYDLLNVKIKKQMVKNLYCTTISSIQMDDSNYQSVLCEFLSEYIKAGTKDKGQLAFLEEYFLKKDINKRYLLNLIHEI